MRFAFFSTENQGTNQKFYVNISYEIEKSNRLNYLGYQLSPCVLNECKHLLS